MFTSSLEKGKTLTDSRSTFKVCRIEGQYMNLMIMKSKKFMKMPRLFQESL